MAETDDKQIQKTDPMQIAAVDNSTYSAFLDTSTFNQMWRAANLLSKSTILPEHYRGKPENCFLGLAMAQQLNQNPTTFLQKTYVVQGKMGMEAQLVIALINTKGPFDGPIRWEIEWDGNDKSKRKPIACTAYAIHAATKERCEVTVTWDTVEKEGWSKKPGSKWLTMPEMMFRYRSATYLGRLYCPEVMMGLYTKDELEDISNEQIQDKVQKVSHLEERLSKKIDSVVKSSNQEINISDTAQDDEDNAETPLNSIQDAPQSKNSEKGCIDPSERYYCRKCDRVMPSLGGLNKNLCGYCLSADVVDRLG